MLNAELFVGYPLHFLPNFHSILFFTFLKTRKLQNKIMKNYTGLFLVSQTHPVFSLLRLWCWPRKLSPSSSSSWLLDISSLSSKITFLGEPFSDHSIQREAHTHTHTRSSMLPILSTAFSLHNPRVLFFSFFTSLFSISFLRT